MKALAMLALLSVTSFAHAAPTPLQKAAVKKLNAAAGRRSFRSADVTTWEVSGLGTQFSAASGPKNSRFKSLGGGYLPQGKKPTAANILLMHMQTFSPSRR